jgi:lipopolysaccharide transport system ATP-binding protein
MSDVAIRVEGLSKSYQITQAQTRSRYKTLQEDLLALPRRLWSTARGKGSHRETFWALKDVSFDVKQGEVLGVIGRNGAGKSTLLKILANITEPTSGRAEIYGRVGSLLEVGTGFHPELTGRENVFLNGAILGMTRREVNRKFDEIVAFAGIEKFLDTPAKHYSSGMYMRLAFAVAAHLEPEILLVDEVLAVGDAEFQRKCLGKMGEVAREGRTVLFVSHNMNAVEELCASALLLESGHLHSISTDVRGIVKQYLFGTYEGQFPSEWINRGSEYVNPWFKPIRFLVTDENGTRQTMPVNNRTDLWVQIEADVMELDPALTVGYAIYTEDGVPLYWTYHTDSAQEDWPQLHVGRCVLRGVIPRRWLNEGGYRLELIGGLHFRRWLFEPLVNAPQIVVTVQGGLSDSPHWMQRRPGVLAPVLSWLLVS